MRRQAALAAFEKLRPGNRVTIEQFLASLQRHREMWAVASALGILDFAQAIAGGRAPSTSEPTAQPLQTRISEIQKNNLKSAILHLLDGKTGMNHIEVTAAIIAGGLAPAGIDRPELPEKLRQPLHELVVERKLHTVGEKRRMKYLAGPGEKKSR